jgi:hypothetical protein
LPGGQNDAYLSQKTVKVDGHLGNVGAYHCTTGSTQASRSVDRDVVTRPTGACRPQKAVDTTVTWEISAEPTQFEQQHVMHQFEMTA